MLKKYQIFLPYRNECLQDTDFGIDGMHAPMTYDLLFIFPQIFHLGLCAKCQAQQDAGVTKSNLFLGHVAKVLKYLKNKYPSVTFIMWDDMLRNCTVDQMKGKHWEGNFGLRTGLVKSNLFVGHVAKVLNYLKNKYPSVAFIMWDDMLRNCTVDQMKGKHWDDNFVYTVQVWSSSPISSYIMLLKYSNISSMNALVLHYCRPNEGEVEHCYLSGFAPASHTFESLFCWLFVYFISSPVHYKLYLKNITITNERQREQLV